jgi:ABC-type cobalamin/Fe3+-siderophores transport system ATPase subunit
MASYSRTMDFLHQKLLQARTKDQEDKIVNWMLAEAQLKQAAEKNVLKTSLDKGNKKLDTP